MNQAAVTAEVLYDKLKDVKLGGTTCLFTPEKCAQMAPKINEILALKVEKGALVLAHSYVSPEILFGVADFVGDSFELAKNARSTDAKTIVFAAVKFMAEGAKIVNPEKTVLVPNKLNGCTLADSISGEKVRELRKQFPDHTFVCYINTTADVKAECDVCVTSSNVYHIIRKIPNDKIYFLPDKLMGENVRNELRNSGIQKSIEVYSGTCYVHEAYDPELIQYLRTVHPGLAVVSHPECNPKVLAESDYVGSTSQMINYVKNSKNDTFFLLTECGLSTRLQLEAPGKKFIGSCTMCRYMKSNTLDEILRVLKAPDPEDIIVLEAETIRRANQCMEAMFHFAQQP